MLLHKTGINAIIGYEVGAAFPGDVRYYNAKVNRPTYPGGSSGVTVGIGYDLGYNTQDQILKDWKGRVNGNILAFMLTCQGLKGALAAKKITPAIKGFIIPYEVAFDVFCSSTLPRFCIETLKAFPGVDELNPLAKSVIVSVVFNRGAGMSDTTTKAQKEGARREMRNLVKAVAKKDYAAIANEIESMKRLWDGVPDFEGDVETKLQGLVNRRIAEAKMVRDSVPMVFKDEDLINILV